MEKTKRPFEDKRKKRPNVNETRVCTNCKQSLAATHFSKKQLRQRNPRHLLCLPCVGRPIPKEHASLKRECTNCGKLLNSDRFSKRQWSSTNRCCIPCVEQAKRGRICKSCQLPKACAGFHFCRSCHLTRKEEHRIATSVSNLPGGVRFMVPDFRNPKRMEFRTSGVNLVDLSNSYEVIYVAIEGEQHDSICSTAKGSLDIRQKRSGEKTTYVGSLQLAHHHFHEKFHALHLFECMLESDFVTRNANDVQSFLSSHVHQFAPDSTWHDPCGDIYLKHKLGPGKLKFVASLVELPLIRPKTVGPRTDKGLRKPRTLRSRMKMYEDVSDYWVCAHFGVPDDVGRLVRRFICPPPVLQIHPGDILLVASVQGNSEAVVVARKRS